MQRQDFRNRQGHLLAYTDYEPCSKLLYLVKAGGNRLGWYDTQCDKTYRANGELIGYGNQLGIFLM